MKRIILLLAMCLCLCVSCEKEELGTLNGTYWVSTDKLTSDGRYYATLSFTEYDCTINDLRLGSYNEYTYTYYYEYPHVYIYGSDSKVGDFLAKDRFVLYDAVDKNRFYVFTLSQQ